MAMVICIFAVLGILVSAFLFVGSSQQRFSIQEEKKTKAYYIAHSGADAAAQALITNAGSIRTTLNTVNPSTITGSAGGGSFSATVTKNLDKTITVVSSGTYSTSQRSVTLKLAPLTATEIFKRVVYSNTPGTLDLTGVDVTGDVEARGSISMDQSYYDAGYHAYPDSGWDPGHVNFDMSACTQDYHLSSGAIKGTKYYNKIDENGGPLVFDTTAGDVYVYVNIFNVKCNINILGNNCVYLHIGDSASLQTPQDYNESFKRFVIYLNDTATLSMQSNGKFNGFIFGPYATVDLQSGNSILNGCIVANIINASNNVSINFQPISDDVDMTEVLAGYKRVSWE